MRKIIITIFILGLFVSIYEVKSQPIPQITNFSPKYSIPGDVITLDGINFSTTISNDLVYFGPVKANVVSSSQTQMSVVVPVGSTFDPITLTINGYECFSYGLFTPTFNGIGVINSSTFTSRQDITVGNGIENSIYADIDGDGKTDLITANYGIGNISIYRNTSSINNISFASAINILMGSNPRYVRAADLDNDGKLDLIVTNEGSNTVSCIRNTSTVGSISFASKVDLSSPTMPGLIACKDIDGDGKTDIAISTWSSGKLAIYRNTSSIGSFSFDPRIEYSAGTISYGLVIQDIDGDNKPDVCIANPGSSNFSVFRNTSSPGSISFATKVDFTSVNSREIAIGDIDGDNMPDLVITNYASNNIIVYRNTSTIGNVSFASGVSYTTGKTAFGVSLGDIDGDSKIDVVVANGGSATISVLKNQSTIGNINLGSKVDFSCGTEPRSVVICDLDNNNKSDLAVSNFSYGSLTIYRNNTKF